MRTTLLILLAMLVLASGVRAQKKSRIPVGPSNKPPVITKFESSAPTVFTCSPGYCESRPRQTVSLSVVATDSNSDDLTYEYSATGGQLFGQGQTISWRLGDQRPGHYSVTVKVTDSKGATAFATSKVAVSRCGVCVFPDPLCPVFSLSAMNNYLTTTETYRGEILRFHVTVLTDDFQTRPDYIWTVANGRILKGQHTPWITVEVTGEPGTSVSASVVVEGFDLSCSKNTEHSVVIKD